jgi:hypothetical protein
MQKAKSFSRNSRVTLHATTFGSLFPNLRDLDSRLGAAGYVASTTYFSNLIEKVSKEDSRLM